MPPDPVAQARGNADELLILLPALGSALSKDVAPGDGRSATASHAGTPCNTDVLSCLGWLRSECRRAESGWRTELGDSPVNHTAAETVSALESLAARFASAGNAGQAQDVAARSWRWLGQVRKALGFTTPATVIDARLVCPECDESPPLVLAGSQGRLRRTPQGWTVDWAQFEVIRCPGCGARWARTEWPFLGRLLEGAAA